MGPQEAPCPVHAPPPPPGMEPSWALYVWLLVFFFLLLFYLQHFNIGFTL